MKYVVLILMIVLASLAGCAKPADVTTAQVVDDVVVEAAPENPVDQTSQLEGGETTTFPINKDESFFTFTGYSGPKSHEGTFEEMEGELIYSDDKLIGAKGVIQAASVKSDGEKLEGHLKSDDFFDVEQFPTIEMESMSIDLEAGSLTGILNFHGVEKTISYPVNVTEEGISADFLLDITDFGMKYLAIDNEVRIQFKLVR